MVERVFTSSTSLNSEAVQHFVTHLCEVSKLEVPRLFHKATMSRYDQFHGTTGSTRPLFIAP